MRLRIQTFPPLPELKAWFIPVGLQAHSSVWDLKSVMCTHVHALKSSKITERDIIYTLEGFELLNDTPFDAVRDGDLICITISPTAQNNGRLSRSNEPETRVKKRKRSSSTFITEESAPKKRATSSILRKRSPINSDSSSDSDLSSSESESISGTSSDSTTSGSSDYSSSSSSSIPTILLPVQKKATTSKLEPLKRPAPNKVTVPPGFGKLSTHDRNRRRRKRQQFLKAANAAVAESASVPPKGSSSVNVIPLGNAKQPTPLTSTTLRRSPSVAEGQDVPAVEKGVNKDLQGQGGQSLTNSNGEQVMMASLRNKNKKKGFKQSLAAPIPRKIIFSEGNPAQLQPNSQPTSPDHAEDIAAMSQSHGKKANSYQRYVTPPSELQERGELPPNLFVTSVDLEEGLLDNKGKRNKKRKDKQQDMEDILYEQDFDGIKTVVDILSNGNEALVEEKTDEKPDFDWERAEEFYDKGVEVHDQEQLAIGRYVGWRTLAINPKTFSPEILLFVARITQLESEPPNTAAVVRRLVRPGLGQSTFMFGPRDSMEDEAVDEEDDESFAWPEILNAKWKLFNL